MPYYRQRFHDANPISTEQRSPPADNGTANRKQVTNHGALEFAFVDRHARAIRMRAGFMAGASNKRLIMPRDTDLAAYGYCPDPNELVANGPAWRDKNLVPSPIPCGQIPTWIVAHFPPLRARTDVQLPLQ